MNNKAVPFAQISSAEQKRSNELVTIIRTKIDNAGGSITFADFMQLALYYPNLGYYSGNKFKLGAQGDFVTAPEISPLFSRCIARQCEQILHSVASSDILELGAGSGIMAKDILLTLAEQECLPEHYFILEPSPDLRDLQATTLQKLPADLYQRVSWLTALPEKFTGIILANEVIDAFPVNIFNWHQQKFYEYHVAHDQKNFIWLKKDLLSKHQAAVEQLPQQNFAENYTTEINLLLTPWLNTLSDSLQRGIILLIDYGFPRREYYHPQRNQGTLMCHYRHHSHTNPLSYVGLQDITSHVDFTLIAETASAADLTIEGYTNQANFLINCGILADYEQCISQNTQLKMSAQQQLHRLLETHEMGELFKVIALSREINDPLIGFMYGNRLGELSQN